MTSQVQCYAVQKAGTDFQPWSYESRALRDRDVSIDIEYCGICHTDLHNAKNEWGMSVYPLVPGHEIIGVVRDVGRKVSKFKVGERVGVGFMVDSCRDCTQCHDKQEQYCPKMIQTSGQRQADGSMTYGGYAKSITVDDHFVLHVPSHLDPAATAPLLCAGITTYSPLKAAGVKKGTKVGIVGLGGLGHVAVRLALAMGAEVTVISRNADKQSEAVNDLKAHHYIASKDEAQMKAAEGSLDFVLDTISAEHDIMQLISLVKTRGRIALVGAPPTPHKLSAPGIIFRGITVVGSLIGSVHETQEMLDFAGKHNIAAMVEIVSVKDLHQAFERLEKSDVHYRFVIDLKTLA